MLRLFVAVAVLLSGVQVSEAAGCYLGTYHDDLEAYLDTSSIRTTNHYDSGCHSGGTHTCSVKAVWFGGGGCNIVNYEVYVGQTVTLCKDGVEVFRMIHAKDPKYLEKNPMEKNLVTYFENLTSRKWSSVPEQLY